MIIIHSAATPRPATAPCPAGRAGFPVRRRRGTVRWCQRYWALPGRGCGDGSRRDFAHATANQVAVEIFAKYLPQPITGYSLVIRNGRQHSYVERPCRYLRPDARPHRTTHRLTVSVGMFASVALLLIDFFRDRQSFDPVPAQARGRAVLHCGKRRLPLGELVRGPRPRRRDVVQGGDHALRISQSEIAAVLLAASRCARPSPVWSAIRRSGTKIQD